MLARLPRFGLEELDSNLSDGGFLRRNARYADQVMPIR
jgi:hypothetical protein